MVSRVDNSSEKTTPLATPDVLADRTLFANRRERLDFARSVWPPSGNTGSDLRQGGPVRWARDDPKAFPFFVAAEPMGRDNSFVRKEMGFFSGSETDFVRRLTELARRVPGPPGSVGIGDDAAVLPGDPARVVTTDLLIEGQHFLIDWMSPEQLAVRSLEVNLSDIAAMGAQPEGTFLGLAVPATPRYRLWAGRLVPALLGHAAERGAPLLGGDTVRSAAGSAVLALTVVGRPFPGGPVLRSGGRPGDILAVSGPLGSSAVGLALLNREIDRPRTLVGRRAAQKALAAFRTPRARLDLARLLAGRASALLDLSDGLGLDLPRLAGASGCGFQVDEQLLPLADPVVALAHGDRRLALAWALSGGEDFELLAAFPPQNWPGAQRATIRKGSRWYPIGTLSEPETGGRWIPEGETAVPWPFSGWDPFRKGSQGLDADRSSRVEPKNRPRSRKG